MMECEVTLPKRLLADIVDGLYDDRQPTESGKPDTSSSQGEPECSLEPTVCAKQFKSHATVHQHVRVLKPLGHCNGKFLLENPALLCENIHRNHNNVRKTHRCCACLECFYTSHQLKVHEKKCSDDSKSSEQNYTTRTEKPKEPTILVVYKDGQEARDELTVTNQHEVTYSHTREKSPMCGKPGTTLAFQQKNTLEEEQRRITKFLCRFCGKVFVSKTAVIQHEMTRHTNLWFEESLNEITPCQQKQTTCRSGLSSEQEHATRTEKSIEHVKSSAYKYGHQARGVGLLVVITKDRSPNVATACQQTPLICKSTLSNSKSSEEEHPTRAEKSQELIENSLHEERQQPRDVGLVTDQSPNLPTPCKLKRVTCGNDLAHSKSSKPKRKRTKKRNRPITRSVHTDGQQGRGLITENQSTNVANQCQQKQSICMKHLPDSTSSGEKHTTTTKKGKRPLKTSVCKDEQQAGDVDLITEDQPPKVTTPCQQEQSTSAKQFPDSTSSDEKHTTKTKKRKIGIKKSLNVTTPSPNTPFSCRRCGATIKSVNGWREHKKQELEPYRCDICGSGFTKSADLVKHHYIHWIQCKFCNELFNYACSKDLNEHENKEHFAQGSRKCTMCDTTYKSSFEQSVHERTHVVGTSRRVIIGGMIYLVPPLPSKPYPLFFLQMHKLGDQECSPYKCSYCDQMFEQENARNSHQETHQEHLPFVCGFCGNIFEEEHSLVHHQVQHIDGTPLPCKYCGKLFKRLLKKAEHEQGHLKPFRCSVCEIRYKEARELVEHHSEHLLKCIYCGEGFSSARVEDLIEHEETHSANEPFGGKGSESVFDPALELITQIDTCQHASTVFKILGNQKHGI